MARRSKKLRTIALQSSRNYRAIISSNVDIAAHGGYEAPVHHPHVEPQYAAPHVDPQYAPPHQDPHQGQFQDQHQHQVC